MVAAMAMEMAGLETTCLSWSSSISRDVSEAPAATWKASSSPSTWHCFVPPTSRGPGGSDRYLPASNRLSTPRGVPSSRAPPRGAAWSRAPPRGGSIRRSLDGAAPRGVLRRLLASPPPGHVEEFPKGEGGQLLDSGRRWLGRRLHARASTAPATAPVAEGVAEQSDTWRNPIGLHAMVWVGGWSEAEVRRAVEGSAKLGYDLIEVPVSEPSTIDKEMTKNVLQEFGLQATASLCLRLDADISSPDGEIAAAGEKLLMDAVDVCTGIGARILAGVTYSALAKYPHAHDKRGPGRTNLVRALKNVARRAADGGVKIGLEVVNRYETNVLNTAQQGVELVEEVGEPNVFVHLDTYHMNIEENSLSGAIELCGDKLQYVHIGESHRGYLGSGQVKWEELFRGLVRAKYKGPLTFESFSSKVVNARLSNDLCVWRNLWDDSEDLARTAKEFIDAQWDAAMRCSVER